MKSTFKHVLKVLAIGGVFALLGFLMSGCDGSGDFDLPDAGASIDGGSDVVKTDAQTTDVVKVDVVKTDAGLGRTDAGMVTCAIPSPTGDAVNPGTGRTARQDALLAAESLSYLAFTVTTTDVSKLCFDMVAAGLATDAGCDNPSDDFRGPGGTRHCFGQEPACNSGLSGSHPCQLMGMGVLNDADLMPRKWAACSTSGTFVGWICNF